MKLRLFAIVLILVGIGSVAFVIVGPNFDGSSASKYTTATVSTGTVAATSVATGSVADSTVYGLRFGVAADIVSSAATTSGNGRLHRWHLLFSDCFDLAGGDGDRHCWPTRH